MLGGMLGGPQGRMGCSCVYRGDGDWVQCQACYEAEEFLRVRKRLEESDVRFEQTWDKLCAAEARVMELEADRDSLRDQLNDVREERDTYRRELLERVADKKEVSDAE